MSEGTSMNNRQESPLTAGQALRRTLQHPALNFALGVGATVAGAMATQLFDRSIDALFKLSFPHFALSNHAKIGIGLLLLFLAATVSFWLWKSLRRLKAPSANAGWLRIEQASRIFFGVALIAILASRSAALLSSANLGWIDRNTAPVTIILFSASWVFSILTASRIRGINEVYETTTDSREWLRPDDRPDVLIVAMSRLFDEKSVRIDRGGDVDQALVRIESDRPDDPFKVFLEATADHLKEHPWQQAARSFWRHFGPRTGGESAAPRICVVLSHQQGPRDLDWSGGQRTNEKASPPVTKDTIGYHEIMQRLLRVRFGEHCELEPHRVEESDSLEHTEAAVRQLAASARRRPSLFARRRRVVIDMTGGKATFSAAAAIASLDEDAAVSYVDTEREKRNHLSLRRISPKR